MQDRRMRQETVNLFVNEFNCIAVHNRPHMAHITPNGDGSLVLSFTGTSRWRSCGYTRSLACSQKKSGMLWVLAGVAQPLLRPAEGTNEGLVDFYARC